VGVDTDALIAALADGALPVRRLKPAWIRGLAWLALGLPPLLLIAMIDGIDVDPRTFVYDRSILFEIAAILATAVTSAICAFASTVPGVNRKWLLLPLVPLAVWLVNIGKSCVVDWVRLGAVGLLLRVDGTCFMPMVLMGIVPIAAMLLMLRRGAPLYPRSTLAMGALAVAALTNLGLRLIHAPDVSLMALAWSFAAVALIATMAKWSGSSLLDWRGTSS
jgi:hypothetical protein